jgi:hypothetical protein
MTDQRFDPNSTFEQQDHDEGMGAADWTMGQGDTATDGTDWQHGGSADNDGGTSGDYISTDSDSGGESSSEPAERNPGG